MIEIKKFVCNMFAENTFVVSDKTKECVIIDCGALYPEEKDAIKHYIEEAGLTPKHLLVTHGHLDHNFGNRFIYDTYNLLPEVCADDELLMNKLQRQPEEFLSIKNYTEIFPPVGHYFRGGDIITFGTHKFKVIQTPGHSPGSVIFHCEEESCAFSGDTLFRFGVGRTDLEGGSMQELDNSLHSKVAKMPWNTIVHPGHGQDTTIREEMFSNPYLGSLGIY